MKVFWVEVFLDVPREVSRLDDRPLPSLVDATHSLQEQFDLGGRYKVAKVHVELVLQPYVVWQDV